jgi:hypothetical protein
MKVNERGNEKMRDREKIRELEKMKGRRTMRGKGTKDRGRRENARKVKKVMIWKLSRSEKDYRKG